MKNDEEHLAMLFRWRNRLAILRVIAGPSQHLADATRIANAKIRQLVRAHKLEVVK